MYFVKYHDDILCCVFYIGCFFWNNCITWDDFSSTYTLFGVCCIGAELGLSFLEGRTFFDNGPFFASYDILWLRSCLRRPAALFARFILWAEMFSLPSELSRLLRRFENIISSSLSWLFADKGLGLPDEECNGPLRLLLRLFRKSAVRCITLAATSSPTAGSAGSTKSSSAPLLLDDAFSS